MKKKLLLVIPLFLVLFFSTASVGFAQDGMPVGEDPSLWETIKAFITPFVAVLGSGALVTAALIMQWNIAFVRIMKGIGFVSNGLRLCAYFGGVLWTVAYIFVTQDYPVGDAIEAAIKWKFWLSAILVGALIGLGSTGEYDIVVGTKNAILKGASGTVKGISGFFAGKSLFKKK